MPGTSRPTPPTASLSSCPNREDADHDRTGPAPVTLRQPDSWTMTGGQNGLPKVGIVGTIAPSVAQHISDPDLLGKLEANHVVLPKVLGEMQGQKPDLWLAL